jgi:CRISPR-associated protein Cas2
MIVIIAYDITESRRRDKIANLLKNYGTRIQYSVFECELTPERLLSLQARLAAMIRPRLDRLHFYPLCKTCFAKAGSLGTPYGGGPESSPFPDL